MTDEHSETAEVVWMIALRLRCGWDLAMRDWE
jgi:hypothetical protein